VECVKNIMIPHHTKIGILTGTSYGEVMRHARAVYEPIRKRTKRKPYVRSSYFKKQKVFIDLFWEHLHQKNPRDRFRRLKYFAAALEVIRESRNHPLSSDNPHALSEILHRFAGITKEGELFYAQVKEDKRSGRKYFISCFPAI